MIFIKILRYKIKLVKILREKPRVIVISPVFSVVLQKRFWRKGKTISAKSILQRPSFALFFYQMICRVIFLIQRKFSGGIA